MEEMDSEKVIGPAILLVLALAGPAWAGYGEPNTPTQSEIGAWVNYFPNDDKFTDEHCFPVNCHDCNTCTPGEGGMVTCTSLACPTVCDEFCVRGEFKKHGE